MQQDLQIRGSFSLNTITGIEKHGNRPQPYTRYKLIETLNLLIQEQGLDDVITEEDIWPKD